MTDEIEHLLSLLNAGGTTLRQRGVIASRAGLAQLPAFEIPGPENVTVQERLLNIGEVQLACLFFSPENVNSRSEMGLFLHGGGWFAGSAGVYESFCRKLAHATGSVIAALEYRLAPETPFPGPLDDCFAAAKWLAEHAEEFGSQPRRLWIAGDSAGGNLAASVAIMARDRAEFEIDLQLLIYPALDALASSWSRSFTENGTGLFAEAGDISWFWELYRGGKDVLRNSYFSPLVVRDARGLAPAIIVTAGLDPLRDEGRAYAQKLSEADVLVSKLEFPDMIHGFMMMSKFIARYDDYLSEIVSSYFEVRRALER